MSTAPTEGRWWLPKALPQGTCRTLTDRRIRHGRRLLYSADMESAGVPTLFDWVGGSSTLEALFERFYEHVRGDALLAPIFANMDPRHHVHVAAFVAEVFGGPPAYSAEYGGHAAMIRKHLGRHLSEPARKRWMALLLDTADELRVPTDPEFRSALVGYLEWGSRLAVINSQPGVAEPTHAPMPSWNWGAPGGPYIEKKE